MKYMLSLLLAFAFGFLCRRTGIEAPAPPTLEGCLLILAITVGYWLGGR
jgi:XapX domain-containing protein